MTEQTADDLIRAGQDAYDAGDRARAHMLWQQAAHLAPKDARVWQLLLLVVDTDDDLRVCLKNLLRLDPRNQKVARQLETINLLAPPTAKPDFLSASSASTPAPLTRLLSFSGRMILSVALIGVLFVLGLVIGVLMNSVF